MIAPAYRQIDRLINFSDAVLAIAVTLLVLPLADKVTSDEFGSIDALYRSLGQQFLLFLISFVVICRFWLVHHTIFAPLKHFNSSIFWLNSAWLLSIVLIPFFTELLGKSIDNGVVTSSLYILNILALSCVGVLIELQIKRHPELQAAAKSNTFLVADALATPLLIGLALIGTVLFAVPGPWLLALLALSSFAQRLLRKLLQNTQ